MAAQLPTGANERMSAMAVAETGRAMFAHVAAAQGLCGTQVAAGRALTRLRKLSLLEFPLR